MSKGSKLRSVSSPSSSIFLFSSSSSFFFLSFLLCCSILAVVGETPSSSPSPSPRKSGNAVRGSSSAPASGKSPPRTRAASSSSSPPPPSPASPTQRREPSSSIMAALKEAPQYSTLVSLITKANLTVSLDTTSPLTVFAPTNDVIEALNVGDTKFLTDPKNVELLKRLVFYHFVNSKILAVNLTAGRSLRSLEGENLIVEVEDGTTFVQGAGITAADDIIREDGVVHGIDSILFPLSVENAMPPPGEFTDDTADPSDQSPSSSSSSSSSAWQEGAPSSDVMEDYSGPPDEKFLGSSSSPSSSAPSYSGELVAALKAHPDYSLIGQLLASAGPNNLAALDSLENDTLFAPSNQGMSSSVEMAQLLTNATARNDILLYHLLAGRYTFSWLKEHPGVYDNFTGFEIVVSGGGTEVFVGNAASLGQIVTPDLYANPKIVVHGINKVLLPPEYAAVPPASASLPLSLSAADEVVAVSSHSEAAAPSLAAASGSWILEEYPADDEGSLGSLAPSSLAEDSLAPMSDVGAPLLASSPSAVDPSSSSMQMTAAASSDVADATAGFVSALARNSNYTQIAFLVGQVSPTDLGELTNNTLFAPSNEAITNFMLAYAALLSDNAKLDEVLKFHVLNGSYSALFLRTNPGDYGGNFSVVVQGDSLRVGYSLALGSVVAPDLYATSSITIHGVDTVLLPPEYADIDVSDYDAAPSAPLASTFSTSEEDMLGSSSSPPSSSSMEMTAATDAPLESSSSSSSDGAGALSSGAADVFISALGRNSNYTQIAFLVRRVGPTYLGELTNNTLFAPSNEAITNFMVANAALLGDRAKLDEVLKFHVLNGSYTASFLRKNPGDYGGNFSVDVQWDNSLMVGYSSARGLVVAPDLYATSKITIHGVDRVLLPPKYANGSADGHVPVSAAAGPTVPVPATNGASSAAGANGQTPLTNSSSLPLGKTAARPSESPENSAAVVSSLSLGAPLVGFMIHFLLFFLK
ncbi:hypothetical protein CBR_g4398 [Chara braunii]|uniref:FAS1 domain-containing protein n=1 Tax=Chara braunii TaxID=69332 RepID=A0A388KHL7_CHABU|nr:hypothetical protein CBR_g4398 [Chara braunii]|eukprot:GBG69564.1 hypothetical protein CBR_g4398 [Chara braunii]